MQVQSPFYQEFTNLGDRGRAKLDVDYYMVPNSVTQARESNVYPQPANVGPYWSAVGYYRDASFVKVQNIMLGYNLPSSLLEKARIKSLRIYTNVLNPLVFTKYDGFDPEWAGASLATSGNASITYQLGVNLKF